MSEQKGHGDTIDANSLQPQALSEEELAAAVAFSDSAELRAEFLIYAACPELHETAKKLTLSGALAEEVRICEMLTNADRQRVLSEILQLSGADDGVLTAKNQRENAGARLGGGKKGAKTIAKQNTSTAKQTTVAGANASTQGAVANAAGELRDAPNERKESAHGEMGERGGAGSEAESSDDTEANDLQVIAESADEAIGRAESVIASADEKTAAENDGGEQEKTEAATLKMRGIDAKIAQSDAGAETAKHINIDDEQAPNDDALERGFAEADTADSEAESSVISSQKRADDQWVTNHDQRVKTAAAYSSTDYGNGAPLSESALGAVDSGALRELGDLFREERTAEPLFADSDLDIDAIAERLLERLRVAAFNMRR